MTDANEPREPEGEPLFSAVLTPHRSLSPTGFVVVMLAIVSCSFSAGLAFWMMGAWPIVGFFGLDIFLIQLAFRMNYRAARASEEITVSRAEVTVRRTAPDGRTSEVTLNPFWARLDVERHPAVGVTALRLRSHGKSFGIASFLGAEERESFANALSAALAEARTPG